MAGFQITFQILTHAVAQAASLAIQPRPLGQHPEQLRGMMRCKLATGQRMAHQVIERAGNKYSVVVHVNLLSMEETNQL